jgi:two-component system, NarL family, sensor histidine kinase DesK
METTNEPTRISSVTTLGARQVQLPRMWYVFVVSCLIFGVFVAGRFILEFPGIPLFLIGMLGLVALLGLYLWITLIVSLTSEDISPSGPSTATVNRRVLLLLGMLLLNHALIPILDFQLWWLFAYTMVAAGLSLPLIQAKILIFGLTALSMLHAWYFHEGFQPILVSLAVLALGAIIIRVMTITNIQLEASRDDAARLAVAEERLRFARDLHDSLGHSLSVIVLKSELSNRIIEQDPERAQTEIAEVERVARNLMHDVRSVVTSYRQLTLARELDAAREILASAGISCTIEKHPELLPPEVDNVLAWGVREGITNVIRHSGAARCTIRVIRDNGTARLEIVDDGQKTSKLTHYNQSGNGLAGLTERVTRAGGWLAANTRPEGGFQLVLEAPTRSEPEPAS